MRHLAACFILCLVGSFLMPTWSTSLADDRKKEEQPAAEAAAAKDTASQEKTKDVKEAKPAGEQAAKPPAEKKDEKDKPSAKKCDAKKAAPSEKPPIHEVEKGPFRVTVQLKGVFEAKRMAAVSLWPDQWSNFTVLKAAEHGQQVKQGELLLAFDPEKIDQAIDDLRLQLRLVDLEIRRGAEQLAALEQLEPMEVAAVDRRQRIAEEDFDQLMKVDLPAAKELAAFYLKSSEEQMVYAQEELNQLEKMYKADDLTEETEEIVLRRARFEAEMAEMSYKRAKQRYDETMKYSLPRVEESAKESIKRDRLGNKRAKVVLPLAVKKARLEMEKAKVERERLDKRLKELLADRALMTIKSPADGVVYYGECVDGRWTGLTSPDKFAHGASIPAKKVLMTVVSTRPILIHSSVPETVVRYLREGLKGKATPTAYPQARLEAVVDEVASAPNAANQFSTRFVVADGADVPVMPGMTCAIQLVPYEKDDALTIPPTALGTDPKDDAQHFVHVVGKDGKSKKRKVEVGERTGTEVEIVKGLSAGDKILKVCPKDDGKPKKPNKPEKK
ncbi:MAG: HlyD family efflux transporter periplasmic adaptor subunit [Pirellulales bacterium]|nr:HlyD family efflux transporter periplasmic adaptor subunit [Pirellulales bacterium]